MVKNDPVKASCTNIYTEIDGLRNFCVSERLSVQEFRYHATQLLLIMSAGAGCCLQLADFTLPNNV